MMPAASVLTPRWRGRRSKGRLTAVVTAAEKILKTATERGSAVNFELMQPKMDFGPDQSLTLMDAAIIRATDADLR
jgi:hypothetical protein